MAKKKQFLGAGVAGATKSSLTFKTEALAKEFIDRMKKAQSKYSRITYSRRGKTVYRW